MYPFSFRSRSSDAVNTATSGWNSGSIRATPCGAATTHTNRISRRTLARRCSAQRATARAAGGQHRVEQQHVAALERRELLVIGRGLQGRVVALQADVPHRDLREQLGHRLEHPEAGPQDRHGDQVRDDAPAAGSLEGRVDLDLHGRDPADGLHDQGDGQALGDGPEHGGRGVDVPKLGQEVQGERVVDHGERHEARMVARSGRASDGRRPTPWAPGCGLTWPDRSSRVGALGGWRTGAHPGARRARSEGGPTRRGMKGRRFALIVPIAVVAMVAAACSNRTTPSATTGGAGSPSGTGCPRRPARCRRRSSASSTTSAAGATSRSTTRRRPAWTRPRASSTWRSKELEPNTGGTNRAELLGPGRSRGTQLIIASASCTRRRSARPRASTRTSSSATSTGSSTSAPRCDDGAQDQTADRTSASLLFAEEQGSFLVGAAAALKSTDRPHRVHRRRRDRPDPEVPGRLRGGRQVDQPRHHDRRQVHHASRRTSPGSTTRPRARRSPTGMYDAGADVVYHAAGGSGGGLFQAAKDDRPSGDPGLGDRRRLRPVPAAPADQQPYILTSMLKRVDVAVYETIKDFVDGTLRRAASRRST